jgi:hypothetical protein
MTRTAAVIGVAVLAAGMVGATDMLPAEAAKVYGVHRVTLARSYGSVRVEGFKRTPDYRDMSSTLKRKGDRSWRGMRAVHVTPIGEGGCLGDLLWVVPGPDINLGPNGGWVVNPRVKVRVIRHPGCR